MGYIFEKSYAIKELEGQSEFLRCSLPTPYFTGWRQWSLRAFILTRFLGSRYCSSSPPCYSR